MKYTDFIRFGTEHACKERPFFIEGKSYVVEDGDILHIDLMSDRLHGKA